MVIIMSNAFTRSWEITKLSFSVINKDRELLAFPFLAGLFSLIFMILMVLPSIIPSLLKGAGFDQLGILEYVIVFVIYLGLAFIATFFNVCVVYTAKKRFEGGNAVFRESISFAFSRIHLIFAWSLLAATVGLILRILDNAAQRMGQTGRIIMGIMISLMGMAWSIMTIFVVPGMVYHNLGPMDAIKRSIQTLKKTWGESLIRHIGLGLVQFMFIFVGIILCVLIFIGLAPLGIAGILIALVIAVLYFLGVILVFGVANTVFNTALYVYADSGRVPEGFSSEIMAGAFTSRKRQAGRI